VELQNEDWHMNKECIVIIAHSGDMTIKSIKQELNNVKIFYCPSELFINDSLKYLKDISDTVLVSDQIFEKVNNIIDGTIWPTSQWNIICEKKKLNKTNLKISKKTTYYESFDQIKVLFAPNNETHVKMLYPISKYFINSRFVIFNDAQNAGKYLNKLGVMYEFINEQKLNSKRKSLMQVLYKCVPVGFKNKIKNILKIEIQDIPTIFISRSNWKPDIIIFGNDWSYTKKLIAEAKLLKIPTVCIMEGPQDFESPGRPMTRANHIFLQGALHSLYLDRDEFYITGNTRLENKAKTTLPKKHCVMINSNFTHGIYEEWRDRWINDIIMVCEKLNIDYFISRHPRDNGDFKGKIVIDSDAFKIDAQIAKATLVISRFSNVVYEALVQGRPVVYYNPHKEDKKILTNGKPKAILYSDNINVLKNNIIKGIEYDEQLKAKIEKFLLLHCGVNENNNDKRAAEGILDIVNAKS